MKTLYHGTSSLNLECIKALGLVPGRAKGGDEWAKAHMRRLAFAARFREPSVFVADNVPDAAQFAHISVEEVGGDPIVITLHVPEREFATFVADELFETDPNEQHAWRVPSIPAKDIGAAQPATEDPIRRMLMQLAAMLSQHTLKEAA